MRGRVMSFWTIAVLGSSTVGGPIVGWVGENVGPRWALALGGLAAIGAAALASRLRARPVSATFETLAPAPTEADLAAVAGDENVEPVKLLH